MDGIVSAYGVKEKLRFMLQIYIEAATLANIVLVKP
jgi:hypothetical protein